MLRLNEVTLVSVTSVNIDRTLKALKYSMNGITYGDVMVCTHLDSSELGGIRNVQVPRMNSLNDYSYTIIYRLPEFIHTRHALIIQSDGFVINPDVWEDEFLDYDYIGAPFELPNQDDPITHRDRNGKLFRVGNGGFSLRSKKLMNFPVEHEIPWTDFHGVFNEDCFICANNRHLYEENGFKFAPLEVAVKFSKESEIAENQGVKTFGFHGKFSSHNSLI